MDPVEQAFTAAPRRWFLPRGARRFAGLDRALVIGHEQTNSQPRTVRDMLRLLDVQPGDHVLDVGAGSGWTTALLAQLTGSDGQVTGVEIVPELRAWGARNLTRCRLPWARIEAALPGRLGWPQGAPYQRILFSANATELPDELVGQLADGGVLVGPVNGKMARVVRGAGGPEISWHGSYSFVPLIEPPRHA